MDVLQDVLECYNTSCSPSFAVTSEPLGHRLKLIQAKTKMMDAIVAKYGEVSGRVAAFGILHHLEDVGSTISPAMEVALVTFSGECLRALSPAIAGAWKTFQAPWRAEGSSAVKAWVDEVHHKKKLWAHRTLKPSSDIPPVDPKV
ncbi:hypothetical protein GUJ93_ZPchr0002g24391 [Zizania palustris]|uniref:Uncharacterized protein n=1 Tax=Zizania palustris TaxID=103762 RepID=A0A8J5VQL5_ZIZPA|nr:hypothetical protein GUJ93_ZPchr0002g24391 [Zizania palustris]